MRIKFDTSEVDRLALDLSRAPGRIQRSAAKVMLVAANKIKKGMRRDADGHDYLPHIGYTVNYDKLGDLSYEIGFDKEGQGNLANVLVYGSVNNAPVWNHTAPLYRELPHITANLGDAAAEAALGRDRE